MFRLDRIDKAWREAGSFNEQVNLFGFIDDQVFLTKSGDAGVVLEVRGVDYECLKSAAIGNIAKRLGPWVSVTFADVADVAENLKILKYRLTTFAPRLYVIHVQTNVLARYSPAEAAACAVAQ